MDSNKKTEAINEVSLLRLYLLRGLYVFVVVGLVLVKWPLVIDKIIHPDTLWELKEGVITCMVTAFSLLCIVGIRYPLQMIPVLLWELIWKVLWLLIVALPLQISGQMDDATMQMFISISFVVIFPFIIPWRYVFANYVKKQGSRWR
jgi:hypothetical protein